MKTPFSTIPCLLLAAAASLSTAQSPPEPHKLQEVPLETESPTSGKTEGGVRIQEHRFWRDQPEGGRSAELEVKIGRIWSEGAETYAMLTVRNTSQLELDQITIHCEALAQTGKQLGSIEQTLTTSEAKPIRPGFTKELPLTLDRDGAKIGSVSCTARGF